MGNGKSGIARKRVFVGCAISFDPRLRHDEEGEPEADYIRQNRVRKGFIGEACEWPFILDSSIGLSGPGVMGPKPESS